MTVNSGVDMGESGDVGRSVYGYSWFMSKSGWRYLIKLDVDVWHGPDMPVLGTCLEDFGSYSLYIHSELVGSRNQVQCLLID